MHLAMRPTPCTIGQVHLLVSYKDVIFVCFYVAIQFDVDFIHSIIFQYGVKD